jgi:hypothetical protein
VPCGYRDGMSLTRHGGKNATAEGPMERLHGLGLDLYGRLPMAAAFGRAAAIEIFGIAASV